MQKVKEAREEKEAMKKLFVKFYVVLLGSWSKYKNLPNKPVHVKNLFFSKGRFDGKIEETLEAKTTTIVARNEIYWLAILGVLPRWRRTPWGAPRRASIPALRVGIQLAPRLIQGQHHMCALQYYYIQV